MAAERVSFAFSGAFFAWPYHAGVAAYLQDNRLVGDDSRIYGTSSGSVVAVMLACGVDVRVGTPAGMAANAIAQGERRTPFFRPRDVMQTYFEIFGRTLPADAHRRASGRLYVSVTQVPRMRRTMISQFASRQALLDALAASIAIPGVTVGLAYRTGEHGWCVDGGPEAPDDDRPGVRTIRVGVGPRLPRGKPDHIAPSKPIPWDLRFLIPPTERRLALFELGYADARRYPLLEAG